MGVPELPGGRKIVWPQELSNSCSPDRRLAGLPALQIHECCDTLGNVYAGLFRIPRDGDLGIFQE